MGTINSEIACQISNCHIDFEYPAVAGNQTLITSWGKDILYKSCNFRYYGESTPMKIERNAVFEHCYFSGPVVKKSAGASSFFVLDHPVNKKVLLYAVIILAVGLILFYSFKKSLWKLLVTPTCILIYFNYHLSNCDLYKWEIILF